MQYIKILKTILGTTVLGGLLLLSSTQVFAQTPSPESIPSSATTQEEVSPKEEFSQAKVIEAKDATKTDVPGYEQPIQQVKLKILSGSEKGKEIEVEHGSLFAIQEEQKVKVGETVVLTKTQTPNGTIYYITDKYRIFPMLIIFGIFLAIVVFLGKIRGLRSIAGLLLSITILIYYVVPQIISGKSPLLISLSAALAIAILTLYLAHGFSRRTTISLVSTIVTLVIACGLAYAFAAFTKLSGTGSEEAIFLRMGPIGAIDLKGLLLGGIVIGVLGVLDDITTAQSVAIEEILKAKPSISRKDLFSRGIVVGQEHIASLVNTLALAYVGASFPLLLLFSLGGDIPVWLTVNSEFIAEEVVRTLVGSIALVLAVPISTFLAAYFLKTEEVNEVAPVVVKARPSTKRKPRK